LDTVNEGFA
jgi:hypothetical protein